jgi:hypothetical protein
MLNGSSSEFDPGCVKTRTFMARQARSVGLRGPSYARMASIDPPTSRMRITRFMLYARTCILSGSDRAAPAPSQGQLRAPNARTGALWLFCTCLFGMRSSQFDPRQTCASPQQRDFSSWRTSKICAHGDLCVSASSGSIS